MLSSGYISNAMFKEQKYKPLSNFFTAQSIIEKNEREGKGREGKGRDTEPLSQTQRSSNTVNVSNCLLRMCNVLERMQ